MTSILSIITATLNSDKYLEQTITSIKSQTFRNIEYIIIDGGSADSTLSIIDKYSSAISYWVSEPDSGIADAMNKGIARASGDYILFLGADDYLPTKDTILKALDYVDDTVEFVFYDVILDKSGDQRLSKGKPFGWWTNFKMSACHQGQITAKSLFDELGGFDTSFKYTMDYDLAMRAYRSGAKSIAIRMPLSVMRLTGISSRKDWTSLKERFDEERRVHMKYCPSAFMKMVYTIYWATYLPYRKIRSFIKS